MSPPLLTRTLKSSHMNCCLFCGLQQILQCGTQIPVSGSEHTFPQFSGVLADEGSQLSYPLGIVNGNYIVNVMPLLCQVYMCVCMCVCMCMCVGSSGYTKARPLPKFGVTLKCQSSLQDQKRSLWQFHHSSFPSAQFSSPSFFPDIVPQSIPPKSPANKSLSQMVSKGNQSKLHFYHTLKNWA